METVPPTQCPTCLRAETEQWRLIVQQLRRLVFGLTAAEEIERWKDMGGRTLMAAAGIRPKSWYERHKEAYEYTGNEIELTRMLRHVKETE